jgi:HAD superfamily hydrolase (TIGR01509 family)
VRVRAVVLDFDGLILDTETPIFETWREEFARRGQELRMADWQHALGTFGGYDPVRHLQELTGESLDADALRLATRERNWQRCGELPVLPGVRELLEDAGRLGLGAAVASSSSMAWVGSWLEKHGLRPLVQAVCTRDDVERVKPAPDLFLLAATRLGVAPAECVVFEDSPNGIRAAKAAGMRCVAVPNAITCALPLGDPDLVLGSLADHPLPRLLEKLVSL